jgi:hypothetical protein
MQPGTRYSATCVARIDEDRRGYLLYAPWRLARDSNVYARWLPGREEEVLARYPGRPVYRVRRAGSAVDAPLLWERLRRSDGAGSSISGGPNHGGSRN